MAPSITVVVPTRNSSHLLDRLLVSIKSQTWPHWHVLIIDGNSTSEHQQKLVDLCSSDNRFSWHEQDSACPGIFGAMNQALSICRPTEWLLFWGSDDWASSSSVFAQLVQCIRSSATCGFRPDLIVGTGRYIDRMTGAVVRHTSFRWNHDFRKSLFFGSTPPHQATLIGPRAREELPMYHPWYHLSADLDYFLRLSTYSNLRVKVVDIELVCIGVGGISAQRTRRRLHEVIHAYKLAFGWLWWFPFVFRYYHRILSLFKR